jgi:hypothetical protein
MMTAFRREDAEVGAPQFVTPSRNTRVPSLKAMVKGGSVALLVLFVSACATSVPRWRDYYPNLALGHRQTDHDSLARWYTSHLIAMREPSLQEKVLQRADAIEKRGHAVESDYHPSSYRFLYLPTFSHPVLFRLEIDEHGTATLITKRTSGKGGYGAGHLTFHAVTPVTAEQRDRARDLIRHMRMKEMRANVQYPALDGCQWILEVADGVDYHLVSRHCARWPPRALPQFRVDESGNILDQARADERLKEYKLRSMREMMIPDGLDTYISGMQSLTETVDYLIDISPLKQDLQGTSGVCVH